MNRFIIFTVLTLLFSCSEEENEARNSILGNYEGWVQYTPVPFPDHTITQPISFTIKKHGLNNIRLEIISDYELSIPVTKAITGPTGDNLITLGYNKDVKHNANGITTVCGDTEINTYGEMCGYYNETQRTIRIHFAWKRNSTSESSAGQIQAERVE